VGDIFNIGIRCDNPCTFDLSTNYISVVPIPDSRRTQFQLTGYTSNVFAYFIPDTTLSGLTSSVEFKIESDSNYNPVELYLSLDSIIYQSDDKKVDLILANGVGFVFTD
jgi:hypothetical protein